MAKYYTPQQVRTAFEKACQNRTQASVAEEIGIHFQNVSVMLKGLPIGGKTLAWLGFRKVTLYERIP